MTRDSKVTGRSVIIDWARIRTFVRRPCRRAKSSDTRIAAAPPQVGGQAISRVSTPGQIVGELSTSSSDTTLRKSASGLFAACRLALARTLANVSSFVP